MKNLNEGSPATTAQMSDQMEPEGSSITGGMTRRGAMGLLGGGLALMSSTGCGTDSGEENVVQTVGAAQPITALVFDAYGTLFDVFLPVFNTAKELYGPANNDLFYETLIQGWRLKQLEYSWMRSLINRYEDFYSCTLSALDFALRSVGIDPLADPTKRDALAARYLTLDAYPEALDVLTQLKARGLKLAILSNGSRDMLQQVVVANGMETVLDKWISTDEVGVFKPDIRVYALAEPQLDIPSEQILFVSSNSFDVLGAKNFGFQTAWIRRGPMPPQVASPTPDVVAPSMLFGLLRARQELEEELALLPDHTVAPPEGTTEGLRGLLTLAPLAV